MALSQYFLTTTDSKGSILYWCGHFTRWSSDFTKAKKYRDYSIAKSVRSKIGKCEIGEEILGSNPVVLPSPKNLTYWIPKLQLDLKKAILDPSKIIDLITSLKTFYPHQEFSDIQTLTRATIGLLAALSWDWKNNGYPDKNEPKLKLPRTQNHAVTCPYLTAKFPTATFALNPAKSVHNGLMVHGDYTLTLRLTKDRQEHLGQEFYPITVPIILLSGESYPIWNMSLFTQSLSGGNIARIDHLINWIPKNDHAMQYKYIKDILTPQMIAFSTSKIKEDAHFERNADLKYSVPGVLLVHKNLLAEYTCPISWERFKCPLIKVKHGGQWVDLFKILKWEYRVGNTQFTHKLLGFESAYNHVVFNQPLVIA